MSNESRSTTASSGGELKPTLGLFGITMNAMALIAPGALLWTTYQLQAPTEPPAPGRRRQTLLPELSRLCVSVA